MKVLRKPLVSMGLLFGATFSLLAGDGQWTNEGLQGTQVYSLGIGQPPRTLFAGADLGVFRSTEAGAWTQVPGSPRSVNVIAADPSDPEILFAGSGFSEDGGLHKSTDGGDHFQQLAGIGFGVRSIAIDPAESDTVYVVGASPQVFKTTDGGATWTGSSDTEELVGRIASLVIDPTRPGTLYAGANLGLDYGFYYYYFYPFAPVLRSVDSGAHWTPAMAAPVDVANQLYTTDLAVDAQTGNLYAATWDYASASVHRSRDGGVTWEQSRVDFASSVDALVVDPATATLYAGTNIGVFRSLDEGSHWTPLNDGLGIGNVSSLVLDSDGVLLAGTSNGVFAIRPNSPSFPCAPSADHLCLLDGQYRVNVLAQNPRTGAVQEGVALPGENRFGSFSLPAFTGDPAFPEVFVKMLDPSQDQGVWFFYGGLTHLPYILTVTDTTTGQIETYRNDPQNRFCGGADTGAFFPDGFQPPDPSNPWDYGYSATAASRVGSETAELSLLDGRFRVTLSAFSALHNRTEPGVAVPGTDRYGYFSLPGFMGDPSFPEVYVKMVDYTTVSGDFWFFHTGLTSLEYTLTVTDSVTGAVRTYESAGDFCGGADTHAFTN